MRKFIFSPPDSLSYANEAESESRNPRDLRGKRAKGNWINGKWKMKNIQAKTAGTLPCFIYIWVSTYFCQSNQIPAT